MCPGPRIAGRRSEEKVSHTEEGLEEGGQEGEESECAQGKERKRRRHDSEVFGCDLSAWWLVGFSSEFLTLINTSGN